jgi:hypothetical protein
VTSFPSTALRVGITGSRSLADDQIQRLTDALQALFDRLVTHIVTLATPGQPRLRFISPLARGADRLAAQAALAYGFSLHVPMPFPEADYEKDFDTPEDLAEFRALRAGAEDGVLALDGDREAALDRSYEAVGRYVVDHSDLVIAIWNGAPAAGRGGTAEIVEYAAARGVPVWWLSAEEDRPAIWIADLLDLRHSPVADAGAALDAWLDELIVPPSSGQGGHRGLIERLAQFGIKGRRSPIDTYFSERTPRPAWPWRAYRSFMCWASGGIDLPWTPPHPPRELVACFWFDRYQTADELASAYAARYRSTYVWVFLLGTFALVFGAAALIGALGEALDAELPSVVGGAECLEILTLLAAGGELLALVVIAGLVIAAVRQRWHERSIEYRILAELCRKQQMLSSLGGVLPVVALKSVADAPSSGIWVSWLFSASQRTAPFLSGNLADMAEGPSGRAALLALIGEQQAYHVGRRRMAEAADQRLGLWGEGLFILVILCVASKLVLAHVFHWPGLSVLFGWLATVLPALSAAFVGIRAYSELQLLAEQSRHMTGTLADAHRRVERLDPARPLASQDFCAEAANVATLMLQDLDGWARLFRVKGVEPG